jgi:predicted Zn-dependent protease
MSFRNIFRLALTLYLSAAFPVAAKPFVPDDDVVVLERLPEKTNPSLALLKRQRIALVKAPNDATLAASVARRAIEAARATGDPRFLGQAQAALTPWWMADDAPAPILVLRATLKQSTHDFEGALSDLDRILAAHPADGQALLTRATVLTVQGRYAEAKRDCDALAGRAPELVRVTCLAGPASLSGAATDAYHALSGALARSAGSDPALQAWGQTLAAEIAARRGDTAAADAHFRAALALDRRDAYLQGAYADFLLDQQRAEDAAALLRDETKNDALLLRLTLALAALASESPDARAAYDRNRTDLAARFDAARRRGDTVHRREEARYALAIEGDPRQALALARQNWAVQREPADLRILAAAANAAGDAEALATVATWKMSRGFEDVTLVAILARAR